MNYEELVKALRYCASLDECGEDCPLWVGAEDYFCICKLTTDAASAIEELDAEETRLLLLTSDLQDKLMDLQAEVKRLELDNEDYEHEHRRLKGEIEALQAELPKRGEWELIDEAEPMRWGCSRCKYLSWETSSYCPRCGAKMEAQE